jgi:acylphosphatase
MEKAVTVRVTGRVQGVWYRGWTEDQARLRGLRGWVRNERDGSVLAVLVGPEETVDGMVEAMRTGPPHARVETVTTEPGRDDGVAGFEVRG